MTRIVTTGVYFLIYSRLSDLRKDLATLRVDNIISNLLENEDTWHRVHTFAEMISGLKQEKFQWRGNISVATLKQ